MKKLELYIETSTWNFYYADDAPEKKQVTIEFFKLVKEGIYNVFISEVVLAEIMRAPLEKRNKLVGLLKEHSPGSLSLTDEILSLGNKYVFEGVIPSHKMEDAIHAAVATVHEMDALVSWNLKHLANLRKMEMINTINMKHGFYKRLELITPMELLYA